MEMLLRGSIPLVNIDPALLMPMMGVKVCAGFPSPADDYVEEALDPSRLIIANIDKPVVVLSNNDGCVVVRTP